ncbi:MAG: biotin transporter BioY [Clostridium sp.]|jgi:biotin transport system substrate-specific component|nr:biotin transporter BioY [Clostridium sp.]
MNATKSKQIHLQMSLYCAFFAALMVVGGYIAIPIGPVPIVLTDFFIMCTGLFLGAKYGAMSCALYLLLGSIGLPVFAGGNGGFGAFFGPTGGFLLGYLPMAALVGWISSRRKDSILLSFCGLVLGNIVLYAIGIPLLYYNAHLKSWAAAFSAGLIPFIPGLCAKIALAATLKKLLYARLQRLMNR